MALGVGEQDFVVIDRWVPTGDPVIDALVTLVKIMASRMLGPTDLYNLSKSVPALWGNL